MALVGIISREPIITLDEWLRLVSETDELAPAPTITFENVFRGGELGVYEPVAGEVKIVIGGKPSGIGVIKPTEDFEDSGELDIWAADGQHAVVRAFAETIATKLRAKLEWDE